MSTAGVLLTVLLAVAGGLLLWASSFVSDNVHSQLAQQKITMPEGQAIASLQNPADREALEPYAGQELLNGEQAKAFADHYILAHMNAASGDRTYEEVSGEYTAATRQDPGFATTAEGQQLGQLRETLFMGNTLRGLLLNAYAFWQMGQIAMIAAIAAFVGAGLLLVLSLLGFRHASQAPTDAELFAAPEQNELART